MLLTLSVQHNHYCCVFLQSNNTALHYAAWGGSNNVITFLLYHGAGVNDVGEVSYHHNYVTAIRLYCIIVKLISVIQYLSYMTRHKKIGLMCTQNLTTILDFEVS